MSNSNTTLQVQYSQIVKAVNVPESIRESWKSIAPAMFREERAVLCYALTTGAWQDIYPQTISEALSMQTPSIGAVALYTGRENTVQLLAEMITSASLLINAGKNIRAEQIYPTAMLLLNNPECRLFTVADFRLALNRGVMGRYGSVYDRFDASVLSAWLNAYWAERLSEAEALSEIAHSQVKSGAGANSGPTNAPEWFSKFVKEFTAKTNAHKEVKQFQPDAIVIEMWENEWKAMNEESRPTFEHYCQLCKMRLQANKHLTQ